MGQGGACLKHVEFIGIPFHVSLFNDNCKWAIAVITD